MILHSKKDLLPDLGFLNISPPRPPPPRKKKKEQRILEEMAGFKSGAARNSEPQILVPD